MRHSKLSGKLECHIAIADFSGSTHDFLQPSPILRQVGCVKVRSTNGDCLRESPNGDSYIVDGAGVRRLDSSVDLKRQVLQLPVRLLDGKLSGFTAGCRIWSARLRHYYIIVTWRRGMAQA